MILSCFLKNHSIISNYITKSFNEIKIENENKIEKQKKITKELDNFKQDINKLNTKADTQ